MSRPRKDARRRVLSTLAAAAMVVAVLPFLASPALAATLVVDDDGMAVSGNCDSATPTPYSTVQSAVTAAADGDTVEVCPGTYAETVTVPAARAAFTLQGTDPNNRPQVTGGLVMGAGLTDLTLRDFRVTNTGQFVIGGGSVTDLTMDNVEVDGANHFLPDPPPPPECVGQMGVAGTQINGAVDIVDSEFINIPCWAVLDTRSGSGGATTGSLLTTFNFSDNYLTNNGGHVVARGTIGFETTSVTISGNTAENYPDAPTNNSASVFKVFYSQSTTFTNNTISNIGTLQTAIGAEGPYGSGLMPRHAGVLTVTDNLFEDSVQGIAYEPRSTTSGGFPDGVIGAATIERNTFLNNDIGILVPGVHHANSTIGALDINYNRFAGNTLAIRNNSASTVNAENNWWGCNDGPNAGSCDDNGGTGTVDGNPWLVLKVSASPAAASTGNTSTVTADMTDNSNSVDSGGFVPNGTPISWATTTGTVVPPNGTFTSGLSTTTWTNTQGADSTVTGTVDSEQESVLIGGGVTDTDVDEGETFSSDPGPDDPPSGADPVQTDVTAPNDNTTVSIAEVPSTEGDQQGYDFFGQQVMIDVSPDGTVLDPIVIGFHLDSSILPPGTTASNVQVFVDQTAPYDDPQMIPTCSNPGLVQAIPDPCIAQRLDGPSASPALDAGDVYIKLYTSAASAWWFGAPNASLPCTITGTNGNDVIFGTGGDDVICALGGNDTVRARGGHDVIYGGSGRDRLYGEPGNDQVWGDDGNDELFGNGDEDELHGGNNNDDIWGAGADDTMFGEAGNDALHGNDGDETMFGGPGNDEAFGGDGDDYMEGNAGKDLLMGGAGQETIFGGADDDAIFGNVDADVLNGEGGEDEISAGEGDDLIDTGNDGDDNLVHAGDGEDTVTAYGGDDEIVTHDGDDTVDAGDGDNVVFTQDGDDTVTSGDGDDFIDTGEDDDSIDSGDGDDLLFGGGGDDVINGGDGDNAVDANEGDDLVLLGVAVNAACLATPQDANECDSTGTAGDNSVTAGGGDDTIVTGDGDDHLLSDGDDDYIDGQNGENGMDGGEGDDDILGGLDHCGAANVDFPATCTSFAPADDQSIDGGGGDDRIATGNGDDHVLGQENDDEIWTDGGEDAVDGMEGKDEIHGGDGNDELLGGGGNDDMFGEAGDDRMGGGAGNDEMWGGNNDDVLFGDTGNDDIDGDNAPVAGDTDDPFSMDECFQNEGTGAPTDCENV